MWNFFVNFGFLNKNLWEEIDLIEKRVFYTIKKRSNYHLLQIFSLIRFAHCPFSPLFLSNNEQKFKYFYNQHEKKATWVNRVELINWLESIALHK